MAIVNRPKTDGKKKKRRVKVRCSATTKKGQRCKMMIDPPAKFCHLHKGWKRKREIIRRTEGTGPRKGRIY